uniref:hypothetical protein n=1 Tax=Hylemonella sp. TaxID=2066020 RepID=UPI0035AEA95C
MSRYPVLVAAFVLAVGLVKPLKAVSPPSIADIEAVIGTRGSRAALHTYFDCGVSGQPAYSQIAKGEKRWVGVAARLLPDADGCFSVLLKDAIARSLSVNPEVALPLVGSTSEFSPARICIPFLAEDYPAKQHLAYLAKLGAALESVRVETLQAAKNACLAEVKRVRGYLK